MSVAGFLLYQNISNKMISRDVVSNFEELHIAYLQADDMGYFDRKIVGQHHNIQEQISLSNVKHLLSDKMQKLYEPDTDDNFIRLSRYSQGISDTFLSGDPYDSDLSYIMLYSNISEDPSICMAIANELAQKPFDSWIGLTSNEKSDTIKFLTVKERAERCESNNGIFSAALIPVYTGS